jgi:hypothetical protein
MMRADMEMLEILMKQIVVAAALSTVVAASALAQPLPPSPGTGDIQANSAGRPQPSKKTKRGHAPAAAYGATTPFGSPLQQPSASGREAAVRDCNAQAAKTYAVRDSNWSLSMYRACMAQHGHPE